MKRRRTEPARPWRPRSKKKKENGSWRYKTRSFVIALAIDGAMLDSVELAGKIEKWGISGVSQLVFIIGGSLGLSKEVLSRADYKLSFSKMTFPIS